MNREIKFRGQNTESKNWIIGSLLVKDETPDIIMTYSGAKHEVIPKTIGQFTGLKDKNGVEIYEADIVKGISENTAYMVEYRKDVAGFATNIGLIGLIDCEVIGNIYENPNLLTK